MMGHEGCQAVLQKALARSEAQETEANLIVQEQGLTRFASNTIHQNVSHNNAQLHVRAVMGKRQGRAVTNDLSNHGIERATARALQNARSMPEDPDFMGLPTPGAPPEVRSYDEATALCSPEARASVLGLVCDKAAAHGLQASGAYRTGTQEAAVHTTRGARAYHASTFAGLIITMMSDTSAGWSKGSSWQASGLDVESLADEAIGKALRGKDPRHIAPGNYAVVLEPYAVDDILGSLSLQGMGAQSVQDGLSWMTSIMGQRAMSPQVSIWDDGIDPGGWPVPFDSEGVPRQRVDIVKKGVVGGPVHGSYTAGKEERSSTGHQSILAAAPMATNLFMREGDESLDRMIASTRRGLYITRFFYTRLVHSRGCVMTGMTRDGVFLVENGQLSYPVKDLGFTQSYVGALAGVEAVGNQSKLVLNEVGFATRVPALKLERFNFTGATV